MKKSIYSNRAKGRFAARRTKKAKQANKEDSPYIRLFKKAYTWLPVTSQAVMKQVSERSGVPISRLITHLIFKEIMKDDPFSDYGFMIPNHAEQDATNMEAADKLYQFIKQFKFNGISIELAYFAMFDIGIKDPSIWLNAYRLLLDAGAITEFQKATPKNLKKIDNKVRATDERGLELGDNL